jgi:hypothetical protein
MAKTILDKLGHRPEMTTRVLGLPGELGDLFGALVGEGTGPVDWTLAFVRDAAAIEATTLPVLGLYRRGGHLWLAYPKKSGALRTDISRDHGWEPVTSRGLLAVTQVAIDETWSALRFRHRDEIEALTRRSERGRPPHDPAKR